MSTSILYHAFGLKGIRHTSTHFKSDALIFRAEMTNDSIRCPKCGCRQASFKGRKTRWFFMSLIGRKKCMLVLDYHRLKCADCASLWWPSLPFMVGKHRYVRSFALTVLDLLRFGTIRSVAQYLGWAGTWSRTFTKPNCALFIAPFPCTRSATSALTSSVSAKAITT